MKIDIRMEDGRPVLFFPDETGANRRVPFFSLTDGHGEACRAYMRRLPKPATPAEKLRAWQALRIYAGHAAEAERT